jgi:Protein of unknown function (DUF2510)
MNGRVAGAVRRKSPASTGLEGRGIEMTQPSGLPGWYPDPGSGGQRYWDGRQWTAYALPQRNQFPTTGSKGSSVPGGLVIAVIAVIAVIVVVIFLVVEKPWESQQYKDCVSGALSERIPGTQQEIEAFCHQLYG